MTARLEIASPLIASVNQVSFEGKPLYWPDGRKVLAYELEVGVTYSVDENGICVKSS